MNQVALSYCVMTDYIVSFRYLILRILGGNVDRINLGSDYKHLSRSLSTMIIDQIADVSELSKACSVANERRLVNTTHGNKRANIWCHCTHILVNKSHSANIGSVVRLGKTDQWGEHLSYVLCSRLDSLYIESRL